MVIDANVLAAYFLEVGDRHTRAAALLHACARWHAPRLWRSELTSVLRQYIRLGGLDAEAAVICHLEAEANIVELPVPYVADVLEKAASSGCSTYDCEYVVSAIDAGMGLYTFDRAILRAFPEVAREP